MHVATMSWFHLTLESDTPIVIDLKAQAESPEERLANIAQRVGMAPAGAVTRAVPARRPDVGVHPRWERGVFDTGAAAETLFKPQPPPPSSPNPQSAKLLEDTNKIIDLWQSATGERVKDRARASPAPAPRSRCGSRRPGRRRPPEVETATGPR